MPSVAGSDEHVTPAQLPAAGWLGAAQQRAVLVGGGFPAAGSPWLAAAPAAAHDDVAETESCVDEADWETESAASEASDVEDPRTVLVGPTRHAVAPKRMGDLWLPQRGGKPGSGIQRVAIRSNCRCLVLSDTRRLSDIRAAKAPLSFGSVLHVSLGTTENCRPCMYERKPGRCNKAWLCDFCHCHVGEAKAQGSRGKHRGGAGVVGRVPETRRPRAAAGARGKE